VTAGWRYWRPA